MRQSFLLLFFNVFFVIAFSQSPVNIQVQLQGLSSEPVVLAYYYGNKQYIKDSVMSDAKGKFAFTYPEALDQGVYLLVFPRESNKYVEFIIDADQQFQMKAEKDDIISSAEFKGSEENTLFFNHLRKIKQFSAASDSDKAAVELAAQQYDAYQSQLFKEHPESFLVKMLGYQRRPDIPETIKGETERFYYYKSHFFDYIDWNFQSIVRTPTYQNVINEYIDNLTVQTPDSLISSCDFLLSKVQGKDVLFQYTLIDLLNRFAKTKTICFDAVYVHLIEKYYLTGQAFWLNPNDETGKKELKKLADAAQRLKPILCGANAYNFNLKDVAGQRHELRKIEAERTLLIFWSADCHKCESFMKELETIAELCRQKDVRIVTVDNGQNTELWKQKVEKHAALKMLALTSSTNEELRDLIDHYDLYETPTVFMLDRNKQILYKYIDVKQIRDLISGLPNK